jgi:hypothetical protein
MNTKLTNLNQLHLDRRIWSYGDMEMRIHSLYQMDTFRVGTKKLHSSPHYASALEIVVNFEVPVLTGLF